MSKNKPNKGKKKISVENLIAVESAVKLPTSLREITPLTDNQANAFIAWEKNNNLVLSGSAGAGKTFIAIYLALRTLQAEGFKRQLVIVRSVVPTRDMGFLPGTQEEKEAAYLVPYIGVVNEIFAGDPFAYSSLVKAGKIKFMTTSFIRGLTINNAIIIVDEMQNCNYHELCSVITRVGKNTRIMFAGDYYQSDFTNTREANSINDFLKILEQLKYFRTINFTWEDCVRSSFVRDFLMTEEMLRLGKLK